MPDILLKELSHEIAWWLKESNNLYPVLQPLFFRVCKRIIELNNKERIDKNDNFITSALNDTVGLAIQSILTYWFNEPRDNEEGLPTDIKDIFIQVCDVSKNYQYGRAMLVSQLLLLYQVAPEWTNEYLIPLFDWDNVAEAKVAWQGFLISPRFDFDLMNKLRDQFIKVAEHVDTFDEVKVNYVHILTYSALEKSDTFKDEHYREAFSNIPNNLLKESLYVIQNALNDAEDKKESYWKNRVYPFFQNIWPKSKIKTSEELTIPFVRIIIASGDKTNEAFEQLKSYIVALENNKLYYFSERILESNICQNYPHVTIALLLILLQKSKENNVYKLEGILDQCRASQHFNKEDESFKKLEQYI